MTVGLIGLGYVNRSLLQILENKAERLRSQYGVVFRVVLVCDSSGVAVNSAGFDPAALRHFKASGGQVSQLPHFLSGRTPLDLLTERPCDLLFEATPVNLQTGEPGLSIVRTALQAGIGVVLANKGPLVLAFAELTRLAAQRGAGLAYSATVCGALPIVNIGQRDLVAAEIRSLTGIFNSTSNYILAEMEQGRSYTEALAEAQRRGIAETDPTLDVEGWDTANKLVILANGVLGYPATLADVQVSGITTITAEQLRTELARHHTVKLVAAAQRIAQGYRLSVNPTVLPHTDFLAQCAGFEMGVVIETDLYGTLYHKIWETDALPTAAAMLRDALNLQRASWY
jgi:homoserine dehydrogenase